MRRILLLAAMLTVALPAAAQASVIPTVAADTLTGDGAADSITLRLASSVSLEVNGAMFDRSTFSKIAIRSGGGDDTTRIADALTETVTIESGAGTGEQEEFTLQANGASCVSRATPARRRPTAAASRRSTSSPRAAPT